MSYKNDLTSNNTDLQGILDTINALPEAGSGGSGGGSSSLETCTVTFCAEASVTTLYQSTLGAYEFIYGDMYTYQLTVLCGSLINFYDSQGTCMPSYSGNIRMISRNTLFVSGDCTLNIL